MTLIYRCTFHLLFFFFCRCAFHALAWGRAISKFKKIGVWRKLPPALRAKARDARGTWSGMKLTQRDLDFGFGRCLGNHRHGMERALDVRGQAS